MGRISYQTANPRDLIAFKSSLEMLPHIRNLLKDLHAPLFQELLEELDPLEDLAGLIDQSIVDDPPVNVREGGIIKEGYSQEADRLRHAKTEGKSWLMELEEKEREKTGIKNLRIRYNKGSATIWR